MKLSGIAIIGGVVFIGAVGYLIVKEQIDLRQHKIDEEAVYYREDRQQGLAEYIKTQKQLAQKQAIPKWITHELYLSIKTGMTRGEVLAILGPGTETARNDLSGFTTIMYQWVNSDGSNMNVMLQNDSVIQKAQFGLR